MDKYVVTIEAKSVKVVEIYAYSADQAMLLVNDMRDHTNMLNFTDDDVVETTTSATFVKVSDPDAPPPYAATPDMRNFMMNQIIDAAANIREALQIIEGSLEGLED